MPSAAAATAMCQIRSAPTEPNTATADTATMLTALDDDDDRALGDPVGGDAADQDERHQARRPGTSATSDSDAGSLSRAMTCSAITTAHMPLAKIDSDTAVISRRYSRNRNGASTRQPAGVDHRLLNVELRAHAFDGR